MADCVVDQQAGSALTPSAGQGGWWFDNQTGLFMSKDAAALAYGRSIKASVASQGPGFASDTYITGSNLLIPSSGVKAGTVFKWAFSMSKTAAATGTPAWSIRMGAAASTADGVWVILSGPAQTAVADVGVFEVMATVRAVGANSGFQATLSLKHNGAAVGFAANDGSVVENVGLVDTSVATVAGKFIGLSVNGGASSAWTISQVRAEADW